MSTRYSSLATVLALILCASTALATVGDDLTFEVLGYDRAGHRLLAVRQGDAEEVLSLWVADLHQPRPRFARLTRLHEDDDANQSLATWRRGLVSLVPATRHEASVQVIPGTERTEWSEWHEMNLGRTQTRVRIALGDLVGEASFDVITSGLAPESERPRVSVGEVLRVPGHPIAIAVVTAYTDPLEVGYFVDEIVFLQPRPTAPRVTPTPRGADATGRTGDADVPERPTGP